MAVNSRFQSIRRHAPLALLLSLALHAFFLIFLTTRPSTDHSTTTPVTVVPIPETQWTSKAADQGRAGKTKKAAGPAISAFAFPQAGDFGSTSAPNAQASGGGGKDDAFSFGQGMDAQGEATSLTFFTALRTRLDYGVRYPSDLSKQRITGRVRIELLVTRKGRFAGRVRDLRTDQPLLGAYVAVAVLHALQTDLHARHWLQPQQLPEYSEIPIAVDVDFKLFGPGEHPRIPSAIQQKNDLVLLRDAYSEPWINEQIQKIFTQYFPPILPIPGGFFVDFVRLYALIENRLNPKPPEEERRVNRTQIERERWDQILKETVHKQ